MPLVKKSKQIKRMRYSMEEAAGGSEGRLGFRGASAAKTAVETSSKGSAPKAMDRPMSLQRGVGRGSEGRFGFRGASAAKTAVETSSRHGAAVPPSSPAAAGACCRAPELPCHRVTVSPCHRAPVSPEMIVSNKRNQKTSACVREQLPLQSPPA